MKKILSALALVVAASGLLMPSAHADTYNFNYLSADNDFNANGQFYTTGNTITGISGNVNGNAITSLLTGQSGGFSYDNQIIAGPTLSLQGVLFSVAGDVPGQEWNLFGSQDAPLNGSLLAWVPGASYTVITSGTLTVSAVPEPATYALMLAGLGVAGVISRRRKPA